MGNGLKSSGKKKGMIIAKGQVKEIGSKSESIVPLPEIGQF